MAITPFHFKLKKVSERQQRLLDALYAYLPATGVRDEFLRGIRDAVSRHAGEDLNLRLESVHQCEYSQFIAKLPQTAVLAVFGMAPLARLAVCEIDAALAMLVVERMLGGPAETMPAPRALSDTEQGVLQYLLLQVLAHIHRLCGKDARVHFRFDRFAFHPHEVRDMADPEDGVAILAFRATLGRHSGFVRLAFPDPFVAEGFLGVEAPDEIRSSERAQMLSEIKRFEYVRTQLWAEAGRATLSAADLSQVEEGDVILFDSSELRLKDGHPEGRVVLKVGTGMHGGYDADIAVDEKIAHATIRAIHKGD